MVSRTHRDASARARVPANPKRWRCLVAPRVGCARGTGPVRRSVPQTFGVGATYGSVNDVSNAFALDGFKPSEYTVSVDYQFEKNAFLRDHVRLDVDAPVALGADRDHVDGVRSRCPAQGARSNYVTLDVVVPLRRRDSYSRGTLRRDRRIPDSSRSRCRPSSRRFADRKRDGLRLGNLGVDGRVPRLSKSVALVLRLTYHNVVGAPAPPVLQRGRGTRGGSERERDGGEARPRPQFEATSVLRFLRLLLGDQRQERRLLLRGQRDLGLDPRHASDREDASLQEIGERRRGRRP